MQWSRNTKQRTLKKFTWTQKKIPQKSRIKEQSNARNNEGESPANHTKNKIPKSLSQKSNFFPRIFFPVPPAIDEKKERCIPLSARTWESPAFLKVSHKELSVYSLEPESKAKIKPPALPQPYMSLLNANLQKALNLKIFCFNDWGCCNCSALSAEKNDFENLP